MAQEEKSEDQMLRYFRVSMLLLLKDIKARTSRIQPNSNSLTTEQEGNKKYPVRLRYLKKEGIFIFLVPSLSSIPALLHLSFSINGSSIAQSKHLILYTLCWVPGDSQAVDKASRMQ